MQSLLIYTSLSWQCKLFLFLDKSDHISDFMYKTEIQDQVQKPPQNTEIFLCRMHLNTKSVIGKSRNASLSVLYHMPHLRGPK